METKWRTVCITWIYMIYWDIVGLNGTRDRQYGISQFMALLRKITLVLSHRILTDFGVPNSQIQIYEHCLKCCPSTPVGFHRISSDVV